VNIHREALAGMWVNIHQRSRHAARVDAVKRNLDAAGIPRASASAGWAAGLLLIAGLAAATNPVQPNAEATRPLQPGAAVPSVSVRAVDGSSVDLAKLVHKTGALLVFYRGGW